MTREDIPERLGALERRLAELTVAVGTLAADALGIAEEPADRTRTLMRLVERTHHLIREQHEHLPKDLRRRFCPL